MSKRQMQSSNAMPSMPRIGLQREAIERDIEIHQHPSNSAFRCDGHQLRLKITV
jgi:hypothetical protein